MSERKTVTVDGRGLSGEPRTRGIVMVMLSNMYPGPRNLMFGSFIERQVKALRRLGVGVRVVANSDPRGGWRSLVKYSLLLVRAVRVARSADSDVVVSHYLYPTAALARVAAAAAGRPYVLVAHGTDARSAQGKSLAARVTRWGMKRASLVVTVSRALEKSMLEDFALPGTLPVRVINMGVDLAVFRPDGDARAESGWPEGEKVVLFAGNLLEGKGVDLLLSAFRILLPEGRVDRLVIVGDGPLAGTLRATAEEYGIAERVEFKGRIEGRQVAMLMAAADVFVLASRNEGIGTVLLEAMASGTPCVGTRVGGIPEVLKDPECGRLVAAEDAQDLARGIAEVLSIGKRPFFDACVARARGNGVDANARRFLDAVEHVALGRVPEERVPEGEDREREEA